MTQRQLSGRTVLITGAGGGLGAAMARELARRGAHVLLTDRQGPALLGLSKELDAESYAADLSDRPAIKGLAAWADDRGATGLVNNAGVVSAARLVDFSNADWDRVMEVNLTSVYLLTKYFARFRVARGGGGGVVNISSMSYKGMTRQVAYVASKGGVVSFTKAAAMELARDGVRVNAVAPGMIETEMTNPADGSHDSLRESMMRQIPLRRYGQPLEVARVVAFLLSDDAAYMTGEVLHVSGGARL